MKAEYKPEDKKLEKLAWATALGVAALLAPGLIIWINTSMFLKMLLR